MRRQNITRIPGRWISLSVAFSLMLALSANLNTVLFAAGEGEELTVASSLSAGQPLTPRAGIEVRLSRPLLSGEGRIAVLIGETDVSRLLTVADTTMSYQPNIVPLPVGESHLAVYLVSPGNDWKEVARLPLRVEASATSSPSHQNSAAAPPGVTTRTSGRKMGFDKAEVRPAFTIGMKAQLAEAHFPDTNRPPRPTFADITLQGSLRSEMTRGPFSSQLQFDMVGASFQQEALRFGQEGNQAPQIDLSSYLMQFQLGKARFSVGHVAFGTNRHLMNSFSSRGISMAVPVSSRGDLSVAAMNGTNVVGWSNFFGLSQRKHQVVSGSFGFEGVKERPGGFRLETSVVDGRVLPLSNFNQGAVTDAERSRGIGFRLLASDSSQRWRLDGGYARSRFTNPADPLLSQERSVVSVREETRAARYLDASYVLLRDLALTETRKANVTLNYRHENVAPLFRSVAAFVQPDRAQNQLEVFAVIGDVTATGSHQRFNDNLGNLASVLTTLSRRSNLIIGAPLSSLLGNRSKPSPWLPRVSYSYDEVHQFSPSFPVGGAFELNLSTIPDQLSRNQSLTADWQWKKSRFGYRFNRSFQDNRQTGRESADLRNLVHGFSFGINPSSKFDLNLEVNAENALNKERNRTDRLLRLGPSINWRITARLALALTVSRTAAGDAAGTSRNRSADVDMMWSYRFAIDRDRYRKVQGNFFFRYGSRHTSNLDTVFGFNNLTRLNTLNTGLSFTFF